MALSADGLLLATGGADATVTLWQTSSDQPLAVLREHTAAVVSVSLSADGPLLASSSYDGTVVLWDTAAAIQAMHGHGSGYLPGDAPPTVIPRLHTLRGDRPYERMDITGLTGVTEAQRAALLALGAVERGA